tara:strand:- start:1850 stop:2758 length:909 start_codon:yes stop_codon:yes gene_type:complete
MNELKVAVFGASGIGKYHVRELINSGCEVVAFLGSSKESSEKTSKMLKESFNVDITPYYELEDLLNKEKINAVSICTPPRLHEQQVRRALNENLHVLCEKPFVLSSEYENYPIAKELVYLAKTKNKVLSVNTQWVSGLEYLKDFNFKEINSFSMYMEPGLKGLDLLTEGIPHMNSMLIRLLGQGEIKKISFPVKEDEEIKLKFDYKHEKGICKVDYNLKFKVDRPRRLEFSINNHKFVREIGENYQQKLINNNKEIKIKDPLEISINKFVKAIQGKGEALISPKEVLENIKLQDIIIKNHQS